MSDDVTQFLQQVQQLQGRRAEEDDARSRELEEKILQEKSERAARRAERARSISPQKSSPANTPPPPSHRALPSFDRLSLASPPAIGSPLAHKEGPSDVMESPVTNYSASSTKENESSFDAESKRTSVTSPSTLPSPGARGSQLSWARRPKSQGSDLPRSRPLSMVAAHNVARASGIAPDEPMSATEPGASKDQIAQSLSTKDPAWFRQTSERGLNSPAYRHSQVEDEERSEASAARAQLPGMTPHPFMSSPVLPPPSQTSRPRSMTVHTSGAEISPALPEESEVRSLERSPTRARGRTIGSRTNSPTKGLGGFVQSAMMKRTDSVKRWSVVSPPGLARADSVASNRNSIIADRSVAGAQPNSPARPASMIRDGSATPTSRPVTRQGPEETTLIEPATGGSQAVADPTPDPRPNLSDTGTGDTPHGHSQDENTTPPTSPSKTMDPRRWSPTKSSWLEAALNKPDSPKPKPAPPASNQPAWMVELNKVKAQKTGNQDAASSKPTSVSQKHEVKIGGLLRSSPAVTATPRPTTPVLGTFESSTPSLPSATASLRTNPSKPSAIANQAERDPTLDVPSTRDLVSIESKARPKTPTTGLDFRGNLKPRVPPPTSNVPKDDGNELKNVFGNLRRTKTQNYVAPDELKSNILRGKAALSATGGPKKSEHKDEFKEAILKKRDNFKKAQSEGTGVTRSSSTAVDQPLPEGLVRRNELGRATTVTHRNPISSPTTTATSSPAASNRNSRSTDISASEPVISRPFTTNPSRTPTTESTLDPAPRRGSVASPSVPTPSSAPRDIASSTRPAGRVGGGKLADRFNPALAGLLARGPPLAALGNKSSESSSADRTSGGDSTEASKPGPQLTHLTKGRARGPRRKAPTSTGPASSKTTSTTTHTPVPTTTTSKTAESSEPRTTTISESLNAPVDKADSATMSSTVTTMAPPAQPEPAGQIQLVDSSKSSMANQVRLVDSSVMSPSYTQSYSSSPSYTRRKDSENNSISAPGQIKLVDSSAMREAYAAATPTRESRGSSISFSYGGGTPTRERGGSQSSFSSLKGALASQVAAGAVQRSSPLTVEAIKGKEDAPREQPRGEPHEEPKSPKKLDMKRMSMFLDDASQPSPKTTVAPESPTKRNRFEQSAPPSPTKTSEPSILSQAATPVAFLDTNSESRLTDPERITPMQSPRHAPVSPSRPLPPPPPSQATPAQSTKPLPQPPSSSPTLASGLASSVKSVAAMFGGKFVPNLSPKATSPVSEDLPSRSRSRSPIKSGERPLPLAPGAMSPGSIPSPMRSPVKQAMEASAALNDFFGPQRPLKREYRADTAEILMQRPPMAQGVQTLSTQRLQIFGDGRMVPVPSHNERVLFEREMYLCSHTFTNETGRGLTEVYFWAGDEVLSQESRSAESHARREARSAGGKLVVLQQGKETPEFLLALGGVVITRRGSSNKYDSLAANMLCGRRHLGSVAFDEVDFSPANLCSGFPYLITQQGQCFLWKGRGSDAEELDRAREIGVDLSLTGQLEEVSDGEEPPTFWDVFDGDEKGISADHWKLKPGYAKYCCRLFCSDSSSKKQIIELSPYSQADLKPTSIYVLDAFFEMYIIVGAQAKPQYASFRNALDFAQEYAILASGVEDRPFVPISTVVLEGIPRDLKSVFRKWRDADSPTIMHPPTSPTTLRASGLQRGRSLRIVPLTQALQALAD